MTLVVLAAGLGSRYGGLKQIDGFGPNGESLMEYSVYDAYRAGFNKVVFVVQQGIEARLQAACGDRISRYMDVEYVVQSNASLSDHYVVPEARLKPLGTAHALFSAEKAVRSSFAVVNADDFYGRCVYKTMYEATSQLPAEGAACMPAYYLKNTLSSHGAVCRGLCDVRHMRLVGIREVRDLLQLPDGTIRDNQIESLPAGESYCPHSFVSMNFWGFTPWIFGAAQQYFDQFLNGLAPNDLYSECILSEMIDALICEGSLSVAVFPTNAQWFGVTHAADKKSVQDQLWGLIDAGIYPKKLFA